MSDNEPTPSQPQTKAELVAEISKIISERRKARGLTLEKIFQSIRIRIPYLEAIEKRRWDELPGDVYIRGFIKRYADHLGLDGEKLLAPYLQFDEPVEKRSVDYPQILKGAEITRFHLIAASAAAIAVIIIVKMLRHEDPVPTLPRQENPLVQSTNTVAAAPISVSIPHSSTPTVSLPVVPGEPHRLEVYSPDSLWLRVSAQDKTFEGFIPQNSTWTWNGKGRFSIRLGHTHEITMLFDGQPVIIDENQKKLELPGPPNEN